VALQPDGMKGNMAKDKIDPEAKISYEFLAGVINGELGLANGWLNNDLEQEQEEALDLYFGKKFGNEEEGFSQVVTRDVLETVEGIMPDLMKIFASGDEVVQFDPIGPHDEEQVEIEGNYINHIFMNRGKGYSILYNWFKDALLMKNGLIRTGWDSKEQIQFREYEGLTEEEYQILEDGESDEDIYFGTVYEIDSSETYKVDDVTYYDCRVKITRMRGVPDIDPVPSENFFIKERSKDIQSSKFVAVVEYKTKGELIEEGYSEEDIEAAVISVYDYENIADSRFSKPNEPTWQGYNSLNGSEYDREVQVAECWVKVFDTEDRKVKKYRCIQLGRTCVEYEEVDRTPIISLSPISVPHKFTGVSIPDLVKDIQEIRSTVFRQMLDNLALQNSGRYTAVEGQVNLQDLIDNKIGGIVRQKMPGAVARLDTPDLSQFTIPVLEQLNVFKEERTGVSRFQQGLDDNALKSHQGTGSVQTMMTAAQNKILLIARNFAETGVKELFVELYNLIREHQTTPDLVPLNGRYALVNPEEWIERYDAHVTVGIGNGNKDQQLFHLTQIGQLLQQIQSGPYGYLIQADNVFKLASEFIKNSGYVNPVEFISNPATVEPPPPPPNPELIEAETNRFEAESKDTIEKEKLGLSYQEFDWNKKKDAAEVSIEATQDRPVGIGDGK
jgi:hypothetical protein